MRKTTVVLLKDAPKEWELDPNFQYCGRSWRGHPRGSKFGNPFRTRDFPNGESTRRYAWEIERRLSDPTQKQFWQDIKSLQGKTLVGYLISELEVLAFWADYLGGYDNSNEGPLYHVDITPEQQREIQKDLDLFIEFNHFYEDVKQQLAQENEVLQFRFDMEKERIVDAHSTWEVVKETMKKPYDRQEMWLEFRRRKQSEV